MALVPEITSHSSSSSSTTSSPAHVVAPLAPVTLNGAVTSTASNYPPAPVSVHIKVLFDDNFPSLELISVHLVDGVLGQLHGVKLHHPGAPGLAILVIEQLDVGHLANLLSEQVLHLLPLHLKGQVGDKDSPLRGTFPGLPLSHAIVVSPVSPRRS